MGGNSGTPGRLTVLIVDDDRFNRMVLQGWLVRDGHTVVEAADGQEAITVFEHVQPDIVLMDVMMPVMDGYEATRRIKAQAGERFVPVIFLTALTDEQALAHCVACGGDDFLSKPYSSVILRAKMAALARVKRLYATVKAQKDALEGHHARLQREQDVAHRVFDRMVHSGCLEQPHLQYLVSPMALFNGDVLLAAHRPAGGLRVLLGDFTGHGLPAAIGAIPVADLFYSMTDTGCAIRDIVDETNRKLKAILPPDLFMAACVLELDAHYRTLTVWNGGIPEVLLCGTPGGIRQRLASRHLPLGVVSNARLDRTVETVEVTAGERVYLYTDGVIEARNAANALFGHHRLEACLQHHGGTCTPFETICHELAAFCAGGPQRDDLTLLAITCDAALANGARTPMAVGEAGYSL